MRFGFVPNPFAVAVAEALADGRIDCGVGGHLQTLEAVLAGHEQVFIAPLAFEERPDHLCICLVAGRPEISSAKDLQNRTVAISARGAMSELQLRLFMADGGAEFETLRITLMPFGRMGDALRSGEVAAASAVEPFVSHLVKSGAGRLIDRGSLSDHLPLGERVLITGVVAGRGWLEAEPAAAGGVARAIAGGIELVKRDDSAARAMIVEYTGVPAEMATSMLLPAFYVDLIAADLQRVFDLAASHGLVDRAFPADQLIRLAH